MNGTAAGFTLGDFWQWAASDLLSNTMRGLVAEFIVARALGLANVCQEEWKPFDLVTSTGVKVEVKSAARRQAWFQRRPSAVRFRIAPSRAWHSESNTWEAETKRQAGLYVFCLLENDPPSPADPLDLGRWTFYILPTATLDKHCAGRKTISLSSLLRLNPAQSTFTALHDAINPRPRNQA